MYYLLTQFYSNIATKIIRFKKPTRPLILLKNYEKVIKKMATYKGPHKMEHTLQNENSNKSTIKINRQNFTELMCDACRSTHIIETTQGYVCGTCGLVLEGQKIIFNKVNFSDIEHYAKLGKTNIGTVKERFANANSVKLNHLQKLHSIESNEKELLTRAKIEISRIFTSLNLPRNLEKFVYHHFIKIRSALLPGTKYRIPEKLIPLCIYFMCKFRNVSINEVELLEVSKISKKEFNAFKLQIIHFFPQYKERDRKSYVLQKILELAEHFKLGMEFYFQCKKILFRLWENIKNTKDEVIAGLVASISVLCTFQENSKEVINVHSICKRLGIKMSTIQSQVKRRIFDQFQVEGFTTLVKSTDLLKKIIEKMGLIDTKKNENKIEDTKDELAERNTPEIIEIKLEGVRQVCDPLKDVRNYFFAFEEKNKYPVLLSLKSYGISKFYSDAVIKGRIKNKQSTSNKDGSLFELEMIK
jgi:hypothetical protein